MAISSKSRFAVATSACAFARFGERTAFLKSNVAKV